MAASHWYYHLPEVGRSRIVDDYLAKCHEHDKLTKKARDLSAQIDALIVRITEQAVTAWSYLEIEEAKKSYYGGKEVKMPPARDEDVPF